MYQILKPGQLHSIAVSSAHIRGIMSCSLLYYYMNWTHMVHISPFYVPNCQKVEAFASFIHSIIRSPPRSSYIIFCTRYDFDIWHTYWGPGVDHLINFSNKFD